MTEDFWGLCSFPLGPEVGDGWLLELHRKPPDGGGVPLKSKGLALAQELGRDNLKKQLGTEDPWPWEGK